MVTWEHGDILIVAKGLYTSKPRPVLVLQDPAFNTGESVIVVPFTSTKNDAIDARIKVSPSKMNGLDRCCFLEVDKLSAINVAALGQRVGKLEEASLSALKRKAIELMGLG